MWSNSIVDMSNIVSKLITYEVIYYGIVPGKVNYIRNKNQLS